MGEREKDFGYIYYNVITNSTSHCKDTCIMEVDEYHSQWWLGELPHSS
jgi:hypothetical protein